MSQPESAAPPAKAPTIYEVAQLAGVSHQTVSRYLKGNGGMKPQTVAKVERAMAQLKYTPNLTARALRTRRSYRVVIVVPEATMFVPLRMLHGAAAAAHEAGYLVDVVAIEGENEMPSERILGLIANEQLAGVLSLVPLGPVQDQMSEAFPQLPLVIAGAYDERMRGRATLTDGSAAEQIVEYLASLGHRRFYHVAGPALWPSAVNRRKTYEQAIRKLGLRSLGVGNGDWSAASGYKAGLSIPLGDEPVTAVFAANDQMAIGVIRALHERGRRVPQDVSVFGWDDTEEGRFLVPSLSTVNMNLEAQGHRAMRELIGRMRNEDLRSDQTAMPPMKLILRESTAPPQRPFDGRTGR